MTIIMDYKMGKLLDVLAAHRMIEKANMETLEKLKKILEARNEKSNERMSTSRTRLAKKQGDLCADFSFKKKKRRA